MRHEWLDCWIKHFGNSDELAVLTSWRDGQLVAAAPMHVVREIRGGVETRVLTFLSSSISPRCNFLVKDVGEATDLFDGMLGLDNWDFVETQNVEDGKAITAQWLAYLAAQSQPALIGSIRADCPLPANGSAGASTGRPFLDRSARTSSGG